MSTLYMAHSFTVCGGLRGVTARNDRVHGCLYHSWSSRLLLEESPGTGVAEAGSLQIHVLAGLVTTF